MVRKGFSLQNAPSLLSSWSVSWSTDMLPVSSLTMIITVFPAEELSSVVSATKVLDMLLSI